MYDLGAGSSIRSAFSDLFPVRINQWPVYMNTRCFSKWKMNSLAFPLRNKLSAEDRSFDYVMIIEMHRFAFT